MKEFTKLQNEFRAAQTKYYEPYENAKTDEERKKVKLDPNLDPNVKFGPLFIKIAKRAKNDPNGPIIEFTVTQVATSNPQNLRDSITRLKTWHLNHPLNGLGMVAIMQGFLYSNNGKVSQEYPETLKMISVKSKLVENRAAALVELGNYSSSAFLNPKTDIKKAAAYYRQAISQYPTTKSARRASSSIFELENLQIGMVAPDFEQVDQDGKSWKLSEYRGQVIVLDFWGFW
jgi:hypothetical protein